MSQKPSTDLYSIEFSNTVALSNRLMLLIQLNSTSRGWLTRGKKL